MIFKNGVLQKDVILEASFPYKNQMIDFFSKIGSDEKTFDVKGQEWIEVYFRKTGVPYFRKKRLTYILDSVIKDCPNSGAPDLEKLGLKNIFDHPKPVDIIAKLLSYFTDKDDIVLDSFAGSGTTGHAVLELNNKTSGRRLFIMVEMEQYAKDITAERVKRAIRKYDYKDGFEFCELDKPLFNEEGQIEEECTFEQLATYIYFTETQTNLDKKNISGNIVGEYGETEYYLLFKEKGKNILGKDFLKRINKNGKKKVVYADKCLIDEKTLEKHKIQFKQIPYEVKVF